MKEAISSSHLDSKLKHCWKLWQSEVQSESQNKTSVMTPHVFYKMEVSQSIQASETAVLGFLWHLWVVRASMQKGAEKKQVFFQYLIQRKLNKVATWCQHCLWINRRLFSLNWSMCRFFSPYSCQIPIISTHPPSHSNSAASFSSSLFAARIIHLMKSMKSSFYLFKCYRISLSLCLADHHLTMSCSS